MSPFDEGIEAYIMAFELHFCGPNVIFYAGCTNAYAIDERVQRYPPLSQAIK